MQVEVWVQQVRVNSWKGKDGVQRTDNLLVCMDADPSGVTVPATLEYVMTPEEVKGLENQRVGGKFARIAVSSLRPVGSVIKLEGRLLGIAATPSQTAPAERQPAAGKP